MIELRRMRSFMPRGGKVPQKYDENFYGKEQKKLLANNLSEAFKLKIPIITNTENTNLYWTLAHTEDENNPSRTWLSQDYMFFDIDDCKYIDGALDPKYFDILKSALELPEKSSVIISSGHGAQVIVWLNNPITYKEYFDQHHKYYKACTKKLETQLRAAGLSGTIDNQVFGISKMVRAPSSLNEKENQMTRVVSVVWGSLDEPSDYSIIKLSGLDVLTEEDDFLTQKQLTYFNIDSPSVIAKEGCHFLSYTKEHQSFINEPQWYAALSILARLDSDGSLCHEWSKDHPSYDAERTETKRQQAIENSGPRTCENIEKLWDGCKTCPHYKKIASPIQIKSPNFISTEKSGFHLMGKRGALTPQPRDLMLYMDKLAPFQTLEKNETVYSWTGTHYEILGRNAIGGFAQAQYFPTCDNKKASEFYGIVVRSKHVDGDWFSKTTDGFINLKNGVLDLVTKELYPHAPERGFTSCLPFDYVPGAVAPMYQGLLDDTLESREKQRMFLEYMAYSLSNGECLAQKFMLLIGPGGSGKSTLIYPFRKLLTKDIKSLRPTDMMNPFMLHDLQHAKINICEEIPKFSEDEFWELIKNWTQGGDIQADQKFKPSIVFENRCKFMFLGNELPKGANPNEGFFRRVLLLETNQSFHDSEKHDPRLGQKIVQNEMSGVLNMLLAAYDTFRARNFKFELVESVENAVDKYRLDIDPVSEWLTENVKLNGLFESLAAGTEYVAPTPKSTHPFVAMSGTEPVMIISDMRKKYVDWANEEGLAKVGTKTFTQRAKEWVKRELKITYKKNKSVSCVNLDEYVSVRKRVNGKQHRVIRGLELINESEF